MFLTNIHNFRTIAIVAIVGAHAIHNFDWDEKKLAFQSLDTLFNQSSIWFFFIAGFLFQYLSGKYETRRYYITKIQNVITPYLILSIPAIIASLTIVDQSMPVGFYEKTLPEQVLLFLLTGKHLAPFWFVPTISLIYLIAPILIAADRAKWPYAFLPPLMILSALLGRDGFLEITQIGGYYSPVSKAIYLFSIYYFGMFCSRFREAVTAQIRFWQWPLLAIAAGAYWVRVAELDSSIEYIFVFKACTAILFVYYLDLYAKISLSRISYVGTASFGIFFIHGYFLAATKLILEPLTGSAAFVGNIIAFICFVIVITAICSFCLWLAQRILGPRSRLVIGV